MRRRTVETTSATPLRPLRVLIEDPQLAGVDLDPPVGVDVTTCSGPHDMADPCPLVMDGTCPLEPFDVVVSALDGPWATCVQAAWGETDTPVVDARSCPATDAGERLGHHLGAALQRLWV